VNRSLLVLALVFLPANSNAADHRPLPETTIQYSSPLNDEERWVYLRYGASEGFDHYVLNTTLRWQLQTHYRNVPGGIDQVVTDAKAAAGANRGRLGPLDIGDLNPDMRRRCLITRQRFTSGVRAASTMFTQMHELFGRSPAVVVSESCEDPGDALRHELVHVSRSWSGEPEGRSLQVVGTGVISSSLYSQFFSPAEIDPRLAAVKRTYSLATSRPVRTVEEAAAAWEWAKLNAGQLPLLTSSAFPRHVGNNAWFESLERTAAAGSDGLTMEVIHRRMTQLL
jgi:hypothetical protein